MAGLARWPATPPASTPRATPPASPWRTPVTRSPPCSAPGPVRWCSPAAPPRPSPYAVHGATERGEHVVVPAIEHSAVRLASAAPRRHRRRVRPPRAGSRPTRSSPPSARTRPSSTCSGATTRWARSSPWPRSSPPAASGACSSTSTPRQAAGHVPIDFDALGADLLQRERPQDGRAAGHRGRCSCGAVCGCGRCSSAAIRSGPGGPGSRTCPAIVGWGAAARPCRTTWPANRWRSAG